VAGAGVPPFCGGVDYVELFNSGPNQVDIGGYFLSDPKNVFTFPSPTIIAAGAFKTYCRGYPGSFDFGLSATADDVSFVDKDGSFIFIGTVQTSSTSTYQRLPDGTYGFGPPSPNATNAVPAAVINEVAPAGTQSSVCGGGQYVELTNIGPGRLSLSGFKLFDAAGPNFQTAYTFGASDFVTFGTYTILCKGMISQTFQFDIDNNDIVTLRNANGNDVSTTGAIGGLSPRPKEVNLVWARAVDLIKITNPDPPFYQYSKNPSPGRANVFPFEPTQPTLKECGIQTAPLPCLDDYAMKETLFFDGYPTSPEFSGGTVDGSTCNHLIVNDEGNIFDMSISGGTVQLKRTIPFIGGTRDNEGMCYYSPGKIAVVDERERSGTCPKFESLQWCSTEEELPLTLFGVSTALAVALCDVPPSNLIVPLYRESSNCKYLRMTSQQIASQTSSVPNEGIEDVACDAANGKLYVLTEKNPRRIWSVDVATGVFSILIDVESLRTWTSKVSDLAGMTYDPLGKTLFVLSEESDTIIQSTLNGTIISVFYLPETNKTYNPEGISFSPATGDIWLYTEPNVVTRLTKKTSGLVCTPTPVAPTKSPVVATESPVAPAKSPVPPIAAPVAPAAAPIVVVAPTTPVSAPASTPASAAAPAATPVAPAAAPIVVRAPAAPVSAPAAAPAAAPALTPAAPVAVPPAAGPLVAPAASPLSSPVAPGAAPTVVASPSTPARAPFATDPATSPMTNPVAAPMAPIAVAPMAPNEAPVKSPTKPTRKRCGLLRFSIICFNGCGFFGRLFRFCK
jgi:uncharacterized protein YjiK